MLNVKLKCNQETNKIVVINLYDFQSDFKLIIIKLKLQTNFFSKFQRFNFQSGKLMTF